MTSRVSLAVVGRVYKIEVVDGPVGVEQSRGVVPAFPVFAHVWARSGRIVIR